MSKPRTSQPSLHTLLLQIRKPCSRKRYRELYTAIVAKIGWVEGYVRKDFKDLGLVEREDVIAHVIDKLVDPRVTYAGQHGEASAKSFAKRIARNKALDECKKVQIRRDYAQAERAVAHAALEAQAPAPAAVGTEPELETTCQRVGQAVVEVMTGFKNGATLKQRCLMVFEKALSPVDTYEQAVRYGHLDPNECEAAVQKAVCNKLDQWRKRTRQVIGQITADLVQQGHISLDEGVLFCTIVEAPLPGFGQ